MVNIPAVIQAMKNVLDKNEYPVALHEPFFAGNEWAYVKDCLDTRWVSSVGKYVDRFEVQLAEYTGVKRAIVVVNGTAALHICLKLADVQGGDEVIVPDLTFIATVNAVSYCGAIPHFADSETRTLGMDAAKLADHFKKSLIRRDGRCVNKHTGRAVKAVMPMHTFGHPVDVEAFVELCGHYGLTLIEDAAESLGSFYKGVHTGNWGKSAVLSFNGNKTITTGGGGAVLTNDENLGALAKHITTTAKTAHSWAFNHDMIGYNYRLPNVNAAIGCAQMEQLAGFIARKRALADRYRAAFARTEGLCFFSEQPLVQSNYWLNVLLLTEADYGMRDSLLEGMRQEGLMVRPAWTLMHKLPMYRECPRMDTSVAEELEARIINIPSSVFL